MHHKEQVAQALAEGKPVPAEVLADYPDLEARAAKKPPGIQEMIREQAEKAGVEPKLLTKVVRSGMVAREAGGDTRKVNKAIARAVERAAIDEVKRKQLTDATNAIMKVTPPGQFPFVVRTTGKLLKPEAVRDELTPEVSAAIEEGRTRLQNLGIRTRMQVVRGHVIERLDPADPTNHQLLRACGLTQEVIDEDARRGFKYAIDGFIRSGTDEIGQGWAYIIVGTVATPKVVAHEVGHALERLGYADAGELDMEGFADKFADDVATLGWDAAFAKYVRGPPAAYGRAQIHTPEFKEWFGDWQNDPENSSKVVDERGEPLVVYHGSTLPADELNIMDPNAAIETRGVVFFSDNEDVAGLFTFPREFGEIVTEEQELDEEGEPVDIEPGAVMEVYLNMRNPMVLDGPNAQRATDDTAYQGQVVEEAKAKGHDGIIFEDVREGIGMDTEPGTTYGVFSANQIKSAISSRFGPGDDIRFVRHYVPPDVQRQHAEIAKMLGLQLPEDRETQLPEPVPDPDVQPPQSHREVGLTDAEDARLRTWSEVVAGGKYSSAVAQEISQKIYNKMLVYARRHPLSDDPEKRKLDLRDIQLAADKMRRFEKKLATNFFKGRETNALNWLWSSRYILADLELVSGYEFQKYLATMHHDSNYASSQVEEAMKGRFAEEGFTDMRRVALSLEENAAIAGALFEQNKEKRLAAWHNLSPKARQVANVLYDILQGYSAHEVREARWRIWDRVARHVAHKRAELEAKLKAKRISKKAYDTRIGGLRAALEQVRPPNAKDSALEEGRKAKAAGNLKGWIQSQTWGTRAKYYMAQGEFEDLGESMQPHWMPEAVMAPDRGVGPSPLAKPEGVQPRIAAHTPVQGPVIQKVLQHLERAAVFNAIADDMERFWGNVTKIGTQKRGGTLSKKDVEALEQLLLSIQGRIRSLPPPMQKLREVNKWFWRMHLGFLPTRGAWFFTRNIFQNAAFGLSQVNPAIFAKAAKDFPTRVWTSQFVTPGGNQWIADDFGNRFRYEVSQWGKISRHLMYMEEGNIRKQWGAEAEIIVDKIAQWPLISDEFNRMLVWPVLHQMAFKEGGAYLEGKINLKSLNARLMLDTLHPTQYKELRDLLDKGDHHGFVLRYSELKTENIHFRYENALRSLIEQRPEWKMIVGLATFPRGAFEIFYQNGVKTMLRGWKAKDYGMATRGLATIAAFGLMSFLVAEFFRRFLGKYAYGLVTFLAYTPLDPGVSIVNEAFGGFSYAVRRYSEGETNEGQFALEAAGSLAQVIDLAVPMSDLFINLYESIGNKEGVRLWRSVNRELRKKMGKDVRPLRTYDRNSYEKALHIFIGGFERKPGGSGGETTGRRSLRGGGSGGRQSLRR